MRLFLNNAVHRVRYISIHNDLSIILYVCRCSAILLFTYLKRLPKLKWKIHILLIGIVYTKTAYFFLLIGYSMCLKTLLFLGVIKNKTAKIQNIMYLASVLAFRFMRRRGSMKSVHIHGQSILLLF